MMYSLAPGCEVGNGEGDSILTISDTAPPLHFDHEYMRVFINRILVQIADDYEVVALRVQQFVGDWP